MDIDYVAIDREQPGYTVFVFIDKSHKKRLAKLIDNDSKRTKLIPWSDFKKHPEKFIQPGIRTQEFPIKDATTLIMKVLSERTKMPIGVAYHGEICITSGDYKIAEQEYKAWVKALKPAHKNSGANRDPGRPW